MSHVGTVLFLSQSAVLTVMPASIERAISYSLAAGVVGTAKAVVSLTELLDTSTYLSPGMIFVRFRRRRSDCSDGSEEREGGKGEGGEVRKEHQNHKISGKIDHGLFQRG